MKLFKKLAAAALAAVLALSMVGCGAGSKGSTSTASELANMLVDSLDQTQIGAKHTGDMDNLAVALATSAGNAENAKETGIKDLLVNNAVLTAAGFTAEDLKDTAYFVSYVENYKPQSPITTEEKKISWMANQIMNHVQNVGKPAKLGAVKALELGASTVKIGDTEYIVVVAKSVETPAPGTTTKD